MHTPGWDPDFVNDAEDVFVKEVAPAVQEIEEKIRDSRSLAELLPRVTRPENLSVGATLGIAAYNLASLPEIAALAVGGSVSFAAAARNVYLEHRKTQKEVEGQRLFFYYETGRRLEKQY